MTKRRGSAAGLVLVVVAGCSSSSTTASNRTPSPTPAASTASPASSEGTEHALSILSGNRFSSDTLTLKAGDSVRVKDTDPRVPHNFTVAGAGHSPTLSQGDTFALTFPIAGHYTFVCTFHQAQGMKGTITVQ